MKIYNVTDKEFLPYGRVLNLDTDEIISAAEKFPMPQEGSIYVPSEKSFEELDIAKVIQNECFGEIPAQVGYCYGHSNKLNALEWHKCSEINIAVTDLVLFLGMVQDIEDGKYNSEKIKAFKLKKGEAIEVYATTLHFCPIETDENGFGCVVGLLEGTNVPLDGEPDDKLLFRKNKWLIAHEDNAELIAKGVVPGICGPNYSL